MEHSLRNEKPTRMKEEKIKLGVTSVTSVPRMFHVDGGSPPNEILIAL